jgi:hypothetical protein
VSDRARVLEEIDVVESEHDNRLADLGRLEHLLHERDELVGGQELFSRRRGIVWWGRQSGRRRRVPDVADRLTHLLGEVAPTWRLRNAEPVDVVDRWWWRDMW